MSCVHPLTAFKTGYLTENGKDDLILCRDFNGSEISIDKLKKKVDLSKVPHRMVDGHVFLTDGFKVPCGSCVGCRMQKAKEWKIRCTLEMQYSPECYFLTLTYRDSCLPINRNGEPYLKKRDYQLFFKRLRKEIGFVRYFGCGEYGSTAKTARPHFHFLIWCHLTDCKLFKPRQYLSAIIAKCWPFGHHLIETPTPGSIAYVAGYVEKKQADPMWNDYPVKPFITMSRKPGIGMAYFANKYDQIKETKRVYGLFSEGSQSLYAPIPKAFKRYLDGVPWFMEFKEICKASAQDAEDLLRFVFKTTDVETIHNITESQLLAKLTTKRKIQL